MSNELTTTRLTVLHGNPPSGPDLGLSANYKYQRYPINIIGPDNLGIHLPGSGGQVTSDTGFAGGGGGGSPGGNNLDIQYNNSGNFGGSDNFQINTSTNTMTIAKLVSAVTGTANTIIAALYQAALSTSGFNIFQVGVSGSANNAAQITFQYAGSGSGNNSIGLGLAAASPGLTVNGGNRVATVNSVLDDGFGAMALRNTVSAEPTVTVQGPSFNLSGGQSHGNQVVVEDSAATAYQFSMGVDHIQAKGYLDVYQIGVGALPLLISTLGGSTTIGGPLSLTASSIYNTAPAHFPRYLQVGNDGFVGATASGGGFTVLSIVEPVFDGDSITIGFDVTPTTRWSYLLCQLLGTTEGANIAVSSSLWQDSNQHIFNAYYDPSLIPASCNSVFLSFGTNDVRYNNFVDRVLMNAECIALYMCLIKTACCYNANNTTAVVRQGGGGWVNGGFWGPNMGIKNPAVTGGGFFVTANLFNNGIIVGRYLAMGISIQTSWNSLALCPQVSVTVDGGTAQGMFLYTNLATTPNGAAGTTILWFYDTGVAGIGLNHSIQYLISAANGSPTGNIYLEWVAGWDANPAGALTVVLDTIPDQDLTSDHFGVSGATRPLSLATINAYNSGLQNIARRFQSYGLPVYCNANAGHFGTWGMLNSDQLHPNFTGHQVMALNTYNFTLAAPVLPVQLLGAQHTPEQLTRIKQIMTKANEDARHAKLIKIELIDSGEGNGVVKSPPRPRVVLVDDAGQLVQTEEPESGSGDLVEENDADIESTTLRQRSHTASDSSSSGIISWFSKK